MIGVVGVELVVRAPLVDVDISCFTSVELEGSVISSWLRLLLLEICCRAASSSWCDMMVKTCKAASTERRGGREEGR